MQQLFMKHEFKKPYYTIYVYELSAGEIWVNDVPLVNWKGTQTENGIFNGEIPINQVVLENGTFQLECRLMPRSNNKLLDLSKSPDIYTIGFKKREVNNVKTKVDINQDIENPYSKWDEQKKRMINKTFAGLPIYIAKTSFEITDLPFVLDGWQDSIDLSKLKEKDLLADVLRYYRQIHSVMASHNVSKFLEISKEKLELQEKAFYFSDERKKSFRESAMKLFNQKLEILPLKLSELKLQIMGYGKLVRLVRLDGSAALQYKSPDIEKQSNVEFDIKLHMRNKEKGLTII